MDFFNKNKYLILIVLMLSLVGGSMVYDHFKCKPVESYTDVMKIQLKCADNVDINNIHEKVCKSNSQPVGCELFPDDQIALIEMFLKEVDECALKVLEQQNMCTDNYEALAQ